MKRKRPIHGFQTRKNKYVLDNRNIKHKEIKKENITCPEWTCQTMNRLIQGKISFKVYMYIIISKKHNLCFPQHSINVFEISKSTSSQSKAHI